MGSGGVARSGKTAQEGGQGGARPGMAAQGGMHGQGRAGLVVGGAVQGGMTAARVERRSPWGVVGSRAADMNRLG